MTGDDEGDGGDTGMGTNVTPSGAAEDREDRTLWHVILAALLSDLLGPTGVEVRSEVPVTAGIPRADIILIRRQGTTWTPEQRCLLADGLRDLRCPEILMEFKFRESLCGDDLSRISMYDYLYLRLGDQRKRRDLQSVIVSARTPRRSFLERYGFQPLDWPGVWETTPRWGGALRLILLNRLANAPHNAPLKLFASREKERHQAFLLADRAGISRRSAAMEEVFVGLWRVLMSETTERPKWRPLTPEDVRAMGQEVINVVGNCMRTEEFMKLPAAARFLEQELEAARKAEREAARNAAHEAAGKAAVEGRASMLRRLLSKRFGSVPGWVADRLSGATAEDLELWGERILTAETIEDVFR